jgi:hypothetical protein
LSFSQLALLFAVFAFFFEIKSKIFEKLIRLDYCKNQPAVKSQKNSEQHQQRIYQCKDRCQPRIFDGLKVKDELNLKNCQLPENFEWC